MQERVTQKICFGVFIRLSFARLVELSVCVVAKFSSVKSQQVPFVTSLNSSRSTEVSLRRRHHSQSKHRNVGQVPMIAASVDPSHRTLHTDQISYGNRSGCWYGQMPEYGPSILSSSKIICSCWVF